jgi:hypothetical protein
MFWLSIAAVVILLAAAIVYMDRQETPSSSPALSWVGQWYEFRGYAYGSAEVEKSGRTTIAVSSQPLDRFNAPMVWCRFDSLPVVPGHMTEVIVVGIAMPPNPSDPSDPKDRPYRLDHCILKVDNFTLRPASGR